MEAAAVGFDPENSRCRQFSFTQLPKHFFNRVDALRHRQQLRRKLGALYLRERQAGGGHGGLSSSRGEPAQGFGGDL